MLQWCIAVRIAIALPQWLSCHVLRCSRVAVGQLHVVPLMPWVAVVTMVWLSLGCACAQHNERKKKQARLTLLMLAHQVISLLMLPCPHGMEGIGTCTQNMLAWKDRYLTH